MQNIETDDTASSSGTLAEYTEKTETLVSYFLILENWDAVSELDPEGTFRLRHTDLSRSALHTFRSHGLIEDAGVEMGAVKTWKWTPRGKLTLQQIHEDTFGAIPELSFQAYNVFERHLDTLVELPRDTSEEFLADEYDLNDGTVAALSRHDFIEAETEREGRANTWTTTRQTRWLTAFMGYSE